MVTVFIVQKNSEKVIKIELIEYNFILDINKHKSYPAIPLHPHNNALQIWLELGLSGMLIFIILLASLFKKVLSFSYLKKFSNSLLVGSLFCPLPDSNRDVLTDKGF